MGTDSRKESDSGEKDGGRQIPQTVAPARCGTGIGYIKKGSGRGWPVYAA